MTQSLLQIKNIKKHYPSLKGKKDVLKGVSFDIDEGEILACLGVNGAGKTTLSSIIVTLIPPSSGSILWKGKSIYENLYPYRKIIGFCPQKPNLEPVLTLDQNLFFAGYYFGLDKKTIQKRKDKLIEKFSLQDQLDQSFQELSRGNLLCCGTEITSGSARRHTYESMLEGLKMKGMDPENFASKLQGC